jgi:hypothetical protein
VIVGFKARTAEELAEPLLTYADEGISHVQLMLDPNTLAGMELAAETLAYLDKA